MSALRPSSPSLAAAACWVGSNTAEKIAVISRRVAFRKCWPVLQRLGREPASGERRPLRPESPLPLLEHLHGLMWSSPAVGALGHPAVVLVATLQLGLGHQVELVHPAERPEHPHERTRLQVLEYPPAAPNDFGALVRAAHEDGDVLPTRGVGWTGSLAPEHGDQLVGGLGGRECIPRMHAQLRQLVLEQPLLHGAVDVKRHPSQVWVMHGAPALEGHGGGTASCALIVHQLHVGEARPDLRREDLI
eukprot:7751713-Pyramimonas_sp.AAC.1